MSQDATFVWAALFLGVLVGGVLALGFYRERSKRIWCLLATLLGGFIIVLGILRYWFLAVTEGTGLVPILGASLSTATMTAFALFGYVQLRSAQARHASHARQRISGTAVTVVVARRRLILLLLPLLLGPITAVPVGLECYVAAEALAVSQDATFVWAALFLGVLAGGVLALGFYRERSKRIWCLLATLLGGFIIVLGILRYWFVANVEAAGLVSAVVGACVVTAVIGTFVFFGYLGLRFTESRRPSTILVDPAIASSPISSGLDR